jgi:DNA-binding GntR family transcriptional regulator
MPASVRCRAGSRPDDLTELRLLIELSAVRKLADRGLSDYERALATKRADATVREARRADSSGYLRADTAFHLCLVDLTGDPALCDVARPLLAAGQVSAPGAETTHRRMAREAREHCQLVAMIADGLVGAVDHLLRLHLSGLAVGWPAPTDVAQLDSVSPAGA